MSLLHSLKPHSSLRFKLTLSVFIMILPLVGLLLYNNFYAIQVVREQVAESYKKTLNHHMSQIDNDLNGVDAYINTVAGIGSTDLASLSLVESEEDYYMQKVYLFHKLVQDIMLYPLLDGFFVYVEHRQDYMNIHANSLPYDEEESIQKYVTNLIRSDQIPRGTNSKRWTHVKIGEGDYFINIVQVGDAYLGAWVKSDGILTPLRSLQFGEDGVVVLANDQYEPITDVDFIQKKGIVLRYDPQDYYLSGTEEKYLIIRAESTRGAFQLYVLISDSTILDNLPYLQRFIWVITLVTLIFIPIGFYYLIRSFSVPLGRVLLAMKKVSTGDWSKRVELGKTSYEFKLLGHSFNSMMDEIQKLRADVYEEQINKQREELQRLQLQLNPHFFLNSLNIVYNLAKVKNYNLIMEMTLALILYFRYLFRSNTMFVKLADELEHTRNYLKIQMLRFPLKLTWDIDAPEYLAEIPVPPLIVQSFVENSIKHALTMEDTIHLAVKIAYVDDSGSKISIRIEDSGKGFPADVLRELQAGRSVENGYGERTGIWNVQRRLRLLYDENASIRFENDRDTGGAAVTIVMPTDLTSKEGGL
ncbi:sensor histidine kinase [Paenibacillus terreus]|uniref:Sensor histidine kinase n=1 Tax=Paenibacillus terreus TaxID=1387834 RepID=A0ABV5BEH3_9BACL